MNTESVVTILAAIVSSAVTIGVPVSTGLILMYGRLRSLEAFVKTYVKMKEGDTP
jgi:hypothetical protein